MMIQHQLFRDKYPEIYKTHIIIHKIGSQRKFGPYCYMVCHNSLVHTKDRQFQIFLQHTTNSTNTQFPTTRAPWLLVLTNKKELDSPEKKKSWTLKLKTLLKKLK